MQVCDIARTALIAREIKRVLAALIQAER